MAQPQDTTQPLAEADMPPHIRQRLEEETERFHHPPRRRFQAPRRSAPLESRTLTRASRARQAGCCDAHFGPVAQRPDQGDAQPERRCQGQGAGGPGQVGGGTSSSSEPSWATWKRA
ncbi:hypothetical protein AAT19DRAFT_13342 [Rhodotorula toruloides]|uniref:Uncharacterized protein n=1 Tax=Rhodotorula toruloides TaxID=5286 RepID=A0A2T0AE95_RHOTO|nr:hypothetical protein AAT19DRAFT_13342 [Rhodotorula toruloides]